MSKPMKKVKKVNRNLFKANRSQAILLAISIAMAGHSHAGQTISGTASVIDGDTLDIHGSRIRLHGIDAPESSQVCVANSQQYRCGQQAALFLDKFISGKPVTCSVKSTDRYGRSISICMLAGVDLSALMVRNGWAMAYREYSSDYVSFENMARSEKLNMWSGSFQKPSEFRSDKKGSTAQSSTQAAQPSTIKPGQYFTCAQAKSAGVAPIKQGSPYYHPNMDGDKDGIACE